MQPNDPPVDRRDLYFEPAGLRLDPLQREVWVHAQRIDLTRLQFDVLRLLLDRRGEVVSFDELSREVWGYPITDNRGYIDTTVYRLRRTLDAAGAADVIRGVRGVGLLVPLGVEPARRAVEANVLDSLQTGILIIDTIGRIRSANRAFADMMGYERDELLQLPSYAILAPGTRIGEYEGIIQRILDGETRQWNRVTARHRDGYLIEIEACAEPFEEDGRIVGVLAEVCPLICHLPHPQHSR
jgi:PAS domain S-box-containing protein